MLECIFPNMAEICQIGLNSYEIGRTGRFVRPILGQE